jgi:hypothetical protein
MEDLIDEVEVDITIHVQTVRPHPSILQFFLSHPSSKDQACSCSDQATYSILTLNLFEAMLALLCFTEKTEQMVLQAVFISRYRGYCLSIIALGISDNSN